MTRNVRLLFAVAAAIGLGGVITAFLCHVPFTASDVHAVWFWSAVSVGSALLALMPQER